MITPDDARQPVAGPDTPTATIGMPVFNGERTLRPALDAILSQTLCDFELIVSDNASTDGTAAICQEYAGMDARVRYIRQPRNIGAAANFRYVLEQARGRYFMWAAADDLRSNDFLAENVRFLDSHPSYVASTSPVRFEDGEFDVLAMGDGSLEGSVPERIVAFLRAWHANGRFYSVFRRDPLLEWQGFDDPYLGSDWSLILFLATRGKFKRIDRGWAALGKQGLSHSRDIFSIHRKGMLCWLLPFHRLSRFAWPLARGGTFRLRLHMAWRLVRLNRLAFVEQFRARRRLIRVSDNSGARSGRKTVNDASHGKAA